MFHLLVASIAGSTLASAAHAQPAAKPLPINLTDPLKYLDASFYKKALAPTNNRNSR